jgi:hypothetical protein
VVCDWGHLLQQLNRASTRQKIDHQHDYSDDEQDMNHPASNMADESQ